MLVAAACVLLLLVAGVVEVGGRRAVEGVIEDRLVEAGVSGDVRVVVGRSWWKPTVWTALVTGDVDRVHVTVQDGELVGLPVLEADYVLSGLRGDVSLWDRAIAVESLDEGRVRLVLDPAAVTSSLGAADSGAPDTGASTAQGTGADGTVESVDISVEDGRLVDGQGRPVQASVEGDELVLTGEGLPTGEDAIRMTVVDPYLLPCEPGVAVGSAGLVLACSGEEVPGVLKAPLAGTGDEPPPPEVIEDLPPPQSTVRPGG